MNDENPIEAVLKTDDNGLVHCGCNSPSISWRPCTAGEGGVGFSIDEAEEMPGWDGLWEREKFNELAKQHGTTPSCANCHGTMNPKMATHELAHDSEVEQ